MTIKLENIVKLNRQEIAKLYAAEIEKNLPMEHYAAINKEILKKYSNAGLIYIKEMAWEILWKKYPGIKKAGTYPNGKKI